jgi:hypothetical protein
MNGGQVVFLCQGRVLSPSGMSLGRPCRNRARWWCGISGGMVANAQALCGVHAKGWRLRWPVLSDDPEADRHALEDTFR